MLLAARRLLFGLTERVELLAREELRIAGDDLGALGDLLLAHAHGPALFGSLEQVALKTGLVVGRAQDGGDAHRR